MKFHHRRELSNLKVVVSRGRRKCTVCKNIINRDEKLLVGYNLDICSHNKKGFRRPCNYHIKLQFCKNCVPKLESTYSKIHDWKKLMKEFNF